MSVCFAIEARRRVVGVAVRCAGGFRFFSSDPAYRKLEGRVFPKARAIDRAAARLASRLRTLCRCGRAPSSGGARPRGAMPAPGARHGWPRRNSRPEGEAQ
jgi:hypothetical protein